MMINNSLPTQCSHAPLDRPPMPITIRPLIESDLPVVDRILRAAFERTHSYVEMLRLNGAAQPGNQLVAVRAGQVVGTVGAVDFGQFAYVALMGVEPAQQGRGIARQLMENLLARLDERGCPVVLLDATEVGAVLYEKLGFVDDSQAFEFEGETPSPAAIAVGRDHRVERMTAADLAEVIAFDTPRFGADRGRLLRILLEQTSDRALVCRDAQGQVSGFLFARTALGPWVAADVATAEQLFIAARGLPSQNPLRVLVPRSNTVACDLLTRLGLRCIRQLRHMRRGGTAPPGQPEQLFGQVSFGLG